ncbi:MULTISPECIES: hypothetical protein [Acidithiobacillus]|jgi:hypothetical protein|uniref:Uncharacterized protein n=2 Tax=Acidithiobacillus TaxID=119977 RepID=A0A179BIM8_ACIFR|nr:MULTISPECIES: hypothetical protein [Acidithiobacillus]MBU2846084.1 hypothetical protein [Acidithiobacillus ferriphilus]MEB8474454.1 hypothetical protein [Acidithiobacillus ferriphilus]MEB8488354.1 hypothetical protein [Acidithiobacillus ferriphilus]MEB8490665.1 hypothetical protein [Acidithiobacillus ferriphilus]MEB8493574.1 hypothetical protein [Acidithiobacillus ferriphilus]
MNRDLAIIHLFLAVGHTQTAILELIEKNPALVQTPEFEQAIAQAVQEHKDASDAIATDDPIVPPRGGW